MNFQICKRIIGKEMKKAEKKASFNYVKKVSCKAVKIILLCIGSCFVA